MTVLQLVRHIYTILHFFVVTTSLVLVPIVGLIVIIGHKRFCPTKNSMANNKPHAVYNLLQCLAVSHECACLTEFFLDILLYMQVQFVQYASCFFGGGCMYGRFSIGNSHITMDMENALKWFPHISILA